MRTRIRWLAPGASALALTFVSALGSCAVGERAEAVFFQQQTVQGALADTIVRLEIERPALAERLYGLEDELHEACAPLREAGSRRVSGKEIDPDLGWAVATAVDACQTKARQVKHLVQQAESGSAIRAPLILDTAAGLGPRVNTP